MLEGILLFVGGLTLIVGVLHCIEVWETKTLAEANQALFEEWLDLIDSRNKYEQRAAHFDEQFTLWSKEG